MIENVMNEAAWKQEIDVKMTYLDLLCLVGNLALSLKHPKNTGPSSKQARRLGSAIANIIYSEFRGLIPPALLREWSSLGFIDPGQDKKCIQKPG